MLLLKFLQPYLTGLDANWIHHLLHAIIFVIVIQTQHSSLCTVYISRVYPQI